MRKPNFFIIGAPKCGTTSLAGWLAQHPNIYMPSVKELHYYATDLGNRRIRSSKEYQRLFKSAMLQHKAVGEASVWYLYSEVAVRNILADVPEAKFIVCLRNPVEMAYSLHGQLLKNTYENVRDFRRAWELQEARAKGLYVPRLCPEKKLLLYGPACSLGTLLERLYDIVPAERVLAILLDDMKSDPAKVYAQTLAFLGVSHDRRTDFPVLNRASERRSQKVAQFMKLVNLLKERVGIPRLGTGIMKFVDAINQRPSRRPPLDADMYQELLSYFSREIAKLEIILRRDLSHWRRVP